MRQLERILSTGLLAGFAAIMFATLLYWVHYGYILQLDPPIVVAAQETNRPILFVELILLPLIVGWALSLAVREVLSIRVKK